MLVWGTGLGLIMAIGTAEYTGIVGGVGADRARMAADAAKAFQAFSFLLGEITSIDTIGGFITTRVLSFAPVLLGLWVAIVGVGLIRGEEQQGALDVLLSTPYSRISVLRQKLAALWIVAILSTLLLGLGLLVGVLVSGEPVPAGELGLATLNLATFVGFWGVVGLLVGQLVLVRRTASSIVGALVFGTFLLNNVLEGSSSLKWLSWLIPFHYYTASKPLVPGRAMEWGAWLVILALTAVLIVMAGLTFSRRNIGSTFRIIPVLGRAKAARGGSTFLLGSPFGKSIRDLLWPTFFWSLGLGLYAILIVSTINEALEPIRQMMKNIGGFLALLVGDLGTPSGYLSYSIFTFLPVLLAAFSITQVEGWASDEEEGRTEVVMTTPMPRWRLLAARYIAITLSLVIILVFLGLFLLLGAATSNVSLDTGRIWASLAAALPVGLVAAAFGLCAATWLKRPGVVIPVTIGLVVIMFFLQLFAPVLNLPDAVLNLSIFHLYGRPMSDGANWAGFLVMVVASLALGAGSFVGVNRRDIAK